VKKYTILGAGLAGQSTSYHIGHEKCNVFEKNGYVGGHIYSEKVNGFIWDEGPHVSFTDDEYVKSLFEKSVNNDYLEYNVETINYFNKSWIPHPAQTNLYSLPEPIRSECLNDFLLTRKWNQKIKPNNYYQWLNIAFGKIFSDEFPVRYTKKYWTVHPKELITDWIGERVYYPDISEVVQGSKMPLENQTHYIKRVRYPKTGGYNSFAKTFNNQSNTHLNKILIKIDLKDKTLRFKDGTKEEYDTLVNTIPLPSFIEMTNISKKGKEAAKRLKCTSLLLINVIAKHSTARTENWIYVYDEDKYSTRINCTELLSPNNGIDGKTGIQVEVYFSDYKKKDEDDNVIAKKVIQELIEMGLIIDTSLVESFFTKWVPWGNVIFNHDYKKALDIVLTELEEFGLEREYDDLEPMTNWDKKLVTQNKMGSIILAGRYGQWKYYWTDDCVLRGKYIRDQKLLITT
jgi:protoporphyrinogen oxidase